MAKQRRDRRTFTEEFKKDLVQQIENGARVSDLAKEHNIQPSQISLWKRKVTGKPGRRGRKPGSTNRATTTSGAESASATTGTRKRASRKRGGARKSSGAASSAASSAPKAAPRAASGSNSSQADVERMIGRLVL